MAVRRCCAVLVVAASATLLTSCTDDHRTGPAADAGQDSSADTDVDTDADTDTDTDFDSGPPGDKATGIAAGFTYTCAVIEGGYVKCWGWDHFGELGYGQDLVGDTDADIWLPATLPFVRVGEEVVRLEAGINTTCALLADGGFKCWGYFDYQNLGVDVPFENNGTIGVSDTPADYPPVYVDGIAVIQLDVGGGQMCAVLEDGVVRCFGNNDHGETGGGTVDLGSPAVEVCTGEDHSCVALENGDVYCWGRGIGGALGYGDTDEVDDPLAKGPVDIGGSAVQVACGYYHTCALLDTGDVLCWGDGQYGQLGYGNTDSVGITNVPADFGPIDVGAKVTQIAAGGHHTCALLESGDVKCWGQGANGHLGYGNTDDVGATNVPADVGFVDVGGLVTLIDAGMEHTCALLSTGAIRCWGNGSYGRLGYGNEDIVGDDETPAEAGDVPLL